MGLTDRDVGITEFLGTQFPFSAVVKQHITDFVVNEVRPDQSVVHLTTCVVKRSENQNPRTVTGPAKDESVTAGSVPKTAEELESAYRALETELKTVTGENAVASNAQLTPGSVPFDVSLVLREIREFVALCSVTSQEANTDSTNSTSLVLPPITDKAARTIIHQWVKVTLPDIVTDTVDVENGARAIRLRRRNECRAWKRKRTTGSDAATANIDATLDDTYDPREDRERRKVGARRSGHVENDQSSDGHRLNQKSFVECILWKMGKDTTGALTEIAKRLRVNVDSLSHAGTKDKRAVTTQRIRIRGIKPERLAKLNGAFRSRDGSQWMALGNFSELSGSDNRLLNLGDLGGNRFTLALRDLVLPTKEAEDNILAAVESIQTRGFVNYFGLQRFGSGTSSTHETGYAVLRGDFAEACRRLLLPVDVRAVVNGVGKLREERRSTDTALNKFAAGSLGARDLLQVLPRWMNVERFIVTSYARGEERGLSKQDHKAAFCSLPRNLRKMYGHAVQSYIWNLMASARIRESKSQFAVQGDIIPEDGTHFGCLSCDTKVRIVTEEEALNQKFPINLVLIPVLGSKVPIPKTSYSEPAFAVLQKENIDLSSLPVDYDMSGTYRWLIAKPKDVESRFISYRDQFEQLIPTEIESAIRPRSTKGSGIAELGRDEHNENGEISPTEMKPSTQSTDKSSIQSRDRFTLESRDSPAQRNEQLSSTANEEFSSAMKETTSSTLNAKQRSQESAPRRGMLLSFTLGPAEYATMLVRELTKQESSVESQIAQQNAAAERRR